MPLRQVAAHRYLHRNGVRGALALAERAPAHRTATLTRVWREAGAVRSPVRRPHALLSPLPAPLTTVGGAIPTAAHPMTRSVTNGTDVSGSYAPGPGVICRICLGVSWIENLPGLHAQKRSSPMHIEASRRHSNDHRCVSNAHIELPAHDTGRACLTGSCAQVSANTIRRAIPCLAEIPGSPGAPRPALQISSAFHRAVLRPSSRVWTSVESCKYSSLPAALDRSPLICGATIEATHYVLNAVHDVRKIDDRWSNHNGPKDRGTRRRANNAIQMTCL
jgi:hypothetical protein